MRVPIEILPAVEQRAIFSYAKLPMIYRIAAREIIKYFFEHYDIDHLLYLFTLAKNYPASFLDPQTIELVHEKI